MSTQQNIPAWQLKPGDVVVFGLNPLQTGEVKKVEATNDAIKVTASGRKPFLIKPTQQTPILCAEKN